MTSKRVNIDFCLPKYIPTKIVMRTCHVDESANSRYYIIIGKDLITTLGLGINLSITS